LATQTQNGTQKASKAPKPKKAELVNEECQWLSSLLVHPQVCALLQEPADKIIAARIQAKLK
jgi:hypothetical protein